ncbi:DUF4878 domain-containing protein [Pseudomonas sp. S 311-6]|uniref:DUF4878 domain-containing protein n=1 Tax=Kerstersia gyiorum TaxID=206506 RepID=UPI0020970AD8|nr:DUF4878 domain-containing protein [Pseudomonas sp. S 311-6]
MHPIRLTACLMVMLTTLLSACMTYSNNTPNGTVQLFYQAIADGNTALALEQVIHPGDSTERNKQRAAIEEMHTGIQANQGLENVRILQSRLTHQGTQANVQAELVFKNGKTSLEDMRLHEQNHVWKILLWEKSPSRSATQ